MAPTSVSPQFFPFLENSESVVLVAYRDVGGVVTVGGGLTELSKAFRRIWRAEHGGKALKVGDTITLGDARRYMRMVLEEEFIPAALTLAPKEQHVLDGETSVLWNCGPGAASWKWAQALKRGAIAEGCRLLLTTAVTSAGKVYNGLKLRRAREAELIQNGYYGFGPTVTLKPSSALPKDRAALSTSVDDVKAYQKQLAALGLYKGAIDGKAGKGSLTEGAVKNFQRAHKLTVDGDVGPSTRAALNVAVRAKSQSIGTWGGGAVSAGGAGIGFQMDGPTLLLIAGGAVVLILVGFALWNNRGLILGKRTPA